MIRIRALNEVSSSSEEEDTSHCAFVTREAREEDLRISYSQALKLVLQDKHKAKEKLLSLLEELEKIEPKEGLNGIENMKYVVYKNLGNICDDNLDYFLNALEIDGRDVTLWIETGKRAMYKFFNFPLARACFEHCFPSSPNNWIIIDKLIDVYYLLNDYPNCFKICLRSLNLDEGYLKAQVLMAQMLKYYPSLKKELPSYLNHLSNPLESNKESQKILQYLQNLKLNRKRKFEDDSTMVERKKKRSFCCGTNLVALINNLLKLAEQLQVSKLPFRSKVYVNLGTGQVSINKKEIPSDKEETVEKLEIPSTEESVSDDNEKEKPKEKVSRRNSNSFPMEFLDKRRSTRVQRIQSKSSDTFDMSSESIYEKVWSLFPKSLTERYVEISMNEDPLKEKEINETDYDQLVFANILNKLKSEREYSFLDFIKYVIFEISSYATRMTIPSNFINLYKIYRKHHELPFPTQICIGVNFDPQEVWCILTAIETCYDKGEALFLNSIFYFLENILDKEKLEDFIIRLWVLRGSKESNVVYYENALEFCTNSKIVYASNKVIYSASIINSFISSLCDNNLNDLLINKHYDELINVLLAKPTLSDTEEDYLSKAIILSENWSKGIDIITNSRYFTEKLIGLLKTCFKNDQKSQMSSNLAKRVLKFAAEKNSPNAWICLLNVFCSECKTLQDEKNLLVFIYTVHTYLSIRKLCTALDGEYLHSSLNFLVNHCADNRDQITHSTILQCFSCLYAYPPKKYLSPYLHPHTTKQIPLLWKNVEIIYNYFVPEELPQYDSLKRISIDADTELLLRKIASVVPEEYNPKKYKVNFDEYLESGKEIPEFSINSCRVTKNLYYLVADYHFKNKEFREAKIYYLLDICINRYRFDSWAASALCHSGLAERKLISTEERNLEFRKHLIQLSESAIRCYEKALEIDSSNAKLWIEYGRSTYIFTSYISRLIKELSKETPCRVSEIDSLRKTKKRLLNLVKYCFESANETECKDEMWIHYYFLGKVAEKDNDIEEALKNYNKAEACLSICGATYPSKIIYQNQTKLSVEALEIHYRIHASVLKILRSNTGISRELLIKMKYYLLKSLRSPFARMGIGGQMNGFDTNDTSEFNSIMIRRDVEQTLMDMIDITEDTIGRKDELHIKEYIIELCLSAMRTCLRRFPEHYKSLYRLAHHFLSMNDFRAAKIILLGRFLLSPELSVRDSLMIENLGEDKSEIRNGLFAERKSLNFYFGNWHIPNDDIDRPESFSSHMYRSTQLLMKVLTAVLDGELLLTLAIQLSRRPEAEKKYLRDDERLKLAKEAIDRCFLLLKNGCFENRHNRIKLESIIYEVHKIRDRLNKCNIFKKETEIFIKEVYDIISKDIKSESIK